jgi:GNAT superfamily N-acetyltransferase
MLSNFGAYILEREGKYIIEDERGFLTYTYLPEYVYIEDVYVRPEYRKQGVASEWADRVCAEAKSKGYSKLLGTIKTKAKTSTESMATLIAYGLRIYSSDTEAIYLTKDI